MCVFILNVVHVFQADFATSAVDFLHRVGRTARAGQIGLVTSMCTESNRELVNAVRRAGELDQPVVNFVTLFNIYWPYSLANTISIEIVLRIFFFVILVG